MGAIVVHLWLPLFAVSLLIVRGLNLFRQVAASMQWFLKRGNEHPFEAIGYVAAIITFLVTLLLQHV
jgi:hypothetical protein